LTPYDGAGFANRTLQTNVVMTVLMVELLHRVGLVARSQRGKGMNPNRARPSEIARSAVLRSVMSLDTTRIWSSLVDLIDRAVATTP
jgi:hypothetical protein